MVFSAASNENVKQCESAVKKHSPSQASAICEYQLEIVVRNGDPVAELDIYMELIDLAHASDDKNKKNDYLDKLKSHYLFEKMPKYQYKWNRTHGINHLHSVDFETSRKYFYDALSIAVVSNNEQWLAISYNDVGLIEKKSGHLNQALYYYNKSLDLRKKDGNLYMIGKSFNNIAAVYFELEEYNDAEKYFVEALALYEDYKKTVDYDERVHYSIIHTYQYLISNNIKSGQTEKLDQNYRHLLDNIKGHFNAHKQIGSIISLARYYTDLQEYQLAQDLLERALAINGEQSTVYSAQIHHDLAAVLFARKEITMAIDIANLGIEHAISHKDLGFESALYQLLSDIYFDDDAKQSVAFLKKYQNKREDFLKLKYDKDVKNMQHRFEKQQIESDLLKSEIVNSDQKMKIDKLTINILIIIIIFIIVSLLFIYYIFKKRIERQAMIDSIAYHKQQLLILEDDQKNLEKSQDSSKAIDMKYVLKEQLVKTMIKALEIWERHTQTNRVELAEQSKVWTVSIDNGNLRTRSLDKYLSIDKIPQNPRWRNVVRTCHFILTDSELSSDDRAKLEDNLAEIMKTIEGISVK